MLNFNARRWLGASITVLFLSACGGSDDEGIVSAGDNSLSEAEVSSLLAIAPFLTEGAADNIVIGDGSQPVVDGNWPRFGVNTTWNWQLNGEPNLTPDADVYVLDMFAQLNDKSIDALHAMGRQVICYFSAGTYEPWRPDVGLFSGFELGNTHIGFVDERWLDINDPEIVKLMINRLDMAVAIGCDGVELDNVDGFVNDTGFNLTQQDALDYTRIMANEAHKRGLAVALKNNVELVPDAVDYFDLLINEECFEYNECEGYLPIIAAGKPVFNAEYTQEHINDPVKREELCSVSRSFGFQTLFLPLALDGSFRISCQ